MYLTVCVLEQTKEQFNCQIKNEQIATQQIYAVGETNTSQNISCTNFLCENKKKLGKHFWHEASLNRTEQLSKYAIRRNKRRASCTL